MSRTLYEVRTNYTIMRLVWAVIPLILIVSLIGMQESFAEKSESIPNPRQQLESGIAINDIQCNNNRLLVLRANGNPACIEELSIKKVVDRFGWKIIPKFVSVDNTQQNSISKIESSISNLVLIDSSITDSRGEELSLVTRGWALINANITNNNITNQDLAYVVKVTDEDNKIVLEKWIVTNLEPDHFFTGKVTWASGNGKYHVHVGVSDNIFEEHIVDEHQYLIIVKDNNVESIEYVKTPNESYRENFLPSQMNSIFETNLVPRFIDIQPSSSKIPYDPKDQPFNRGWVGPPPFTMISYVEDYNLFELDSSKKMKLPTRYTINQMQDAGTFPLSGVRPTFEIDPVSFAPKYVPEGLEAKFVAFGEASEITRVVYYYAPNTLEFDINTTEHDIGKNHGFDITVSTKPDQKPWSDGSIKTDKAKYDYKWVDYSFNGYPTVSLNGIGVDGEFSPRSSSAISYRDYNVSIYLHSYHHDFEELRNIFESMFLEYDPPILNPSDVEVKLRTYGGLFDGTLSVNQKWPTRVGSDNIDPFARLPQYVPSNLDLHTVYYHEKDTWNDEFNQISLWYVLNNHKFVEYETSLDVGINVVITDFVEYDEDLITKFAKENNINLDSFNDSMSLNIEFEKGAYLLFYDKDSQIELYSKKYNLDELTKIGESLIGQK